ncbi:MAG: YjiG family protein [Burkholderiaceae bacterium]
MSSHSQANKNVMDHFVDGARKGINIALTSTLPNVMMAFVIIQILKVSGLLGLIGVVFSPIMGLWGLPGESATVLAAAFMSMGGAVGVVAGLMSSNLLDGSQVTILIPAIYLMGSLIQYVGRILGTAETNKHYWGVMLAICVLNALLAMTVMRFIVTIF